MPKVTALSTIEHDGKVYGEGDSLEVSKEQADALRVAGVIETGRAAEAQEAEVVDTPPAPKPPTKAQMIEEATAEGLTLDVTTDNTVAEVKAAIEAARAAKASETQE